MGSGIYGLRKGGVDKVTYLHFGGGPDILGDEIVQFCREYPAHCLSEVFDRIVMVGMQDYPTEEQIAECRPFMGDSQHAFGDDPDWYEVLEATRGSLDSYVEGLRYMEDYSSFMTSSGDCECAYIINLDSGKLEFWKGYQKKPQPGNRYGEKKRGSFCPCALRLEFDLAELPQDALGQMKKIKK